MMKSTLLTGAALAILAACNQAMPEAPEAEAQKLSATHAIDTPAPVAALAFSPNDVASWLGAIAMVTDAGALLITDIEGVKPKPQSGGPFVDVIGANRDGQPALFLALTDTGELRPFIEADDEGNFKALPISNEAKEIAVLCKPADGLSDTLTVISAAGDITTLSAEIGASAVLRRAEALGKAKGASACVTAGDQVFTLSGNKLSEADGKSVTVNAGVTGLAIFKAETATYIATSKAGSAAMSLYNADSLSPVGTFDIASGLSIGGLDGASGVWATSEAYGGSGFNAGVIALSDSNESRLVFMSKSYILNELAKADAR